MKIHIDTDALLQAIERRLGEISDRQHALAAERAHLVDQLTPLRLGVASPETAVVLLRSKGITLRDVASAPPPGRRHRGVVLRAVVPPRVRLAALPLPHSETA